MTTNEGSIKPESLTAQDFWSALHLSLSQISAEFKTPCHEASSSETKAVEYHKSFPAPGQMKLARGEPIKIIKLPNGTTLDNPCPLTDKAKSYGLGVNHLNLIQVKGNPIHSWQPKLVSDQENGLTVSRPKLDNIHINQILIKHLEKTPSCTSCSVSKK